MRSTGEWTGGRCGWGSQRAHAASCKVNKFWEGVDAQRADRVNGLYRVLEVVRE